VFGFGLIGMKNQFRKRILMRLARLERIKHEPDQNRPIIFKKFRIQDFYNNLRFSEKYFIKFFLDLYLFIMQINFYLEIKIISGGWLLKINSFALFIKFVSVGKYTLFVFKYIAEIIFTMCNTLLETNVASNYPIIKVNTLEMAQIISWGRLSSLFFAFAI